MLTFSDYVVKFMGRARAVINDVTFANYTFHVREAHGGIILQATFPAPCQRTGLVDIQFTRKWLLSPEMTDSEIVGTAMLCVLTSVEHEAREEFEYQGRAIYGPHQRLEVLGTALDERESSALPPRLATAVPAASQR